MILYVRSMRSVAVAVMAFYAVVNIVSLFGYDLGQLLPPRAQAQPDWIWLMFVPVFLYGLIAAISMLVGSVARSAPEPPIKSWIPCWTLGLYAVTLVVIDVIRYHGGGPLMHDGQQTIWYKADGLYIAVPPDEYHRAMAFEAQMASAAYLTILYAIWLRFGEWLRVTPQTSRSPQNGTGT